MGQFQQQLIRLLACVVAIDLAVGVVVIQHRSVRVSTVSAGAPASNTSPPSTVAPGGAATTRPGGILGGGSFGSRRRSKLPATSQATTGSSAASAPSAPSTAAPPSARAPAPSTSGSAKSTPRQPAPAAGRATTTATSGDAGIAVPPPTAATGEPGTAEPDEPPGDAAAPARSTPGSTAPPKTTTPSYTSGVWTVIDDPTGDTVVDSTRAPQPNPAADIVQSRVTNTTKAVGFAVKVAQPADPTRDPNWTSPATFVLWEVDTGGDGKPDYEIEYFVEGGKLIGGVSRLSGNDRQAACEAEAGYMSESYLVGIDPACLGSPASLSYRATVFYGADPNGEDSIIDVAPDGGMTGPVRRTAA